MRFFNHLTSHLTPEWRQHYIDYGDLKGRIYQMVQEKTSEQVLQEENELKGYLIVKR